MLHLSNLQTSTNSRTVAAVLLYSAIYKRSPEAQRHFIQQWLNVNIEIREQLRFAATNNFASDPNLTLRQQCAHLLGLFYAIEFSSFCIRDPINPTFKSLFIELVETAQNTPDPELKCLLYSLFATFSFHTQEINPNCAKDRNITDIIKQSRLLEVFLIGMRTMHPIVQKAAIQAMTVSLLVLKREISFENNRDALMVTLFEIITGSLEVPDLYIAGCQLLRKLIDYCYPDVIAHMKSIEEITLNDLRSGVPDRQIQACFIWSVVAEVEWDINNPEKHQVKYKHREFHQLGGDGFSLDAFRNLFESLVLIMCNINENETDANIGIELSPVNAAFVCISNLAKAIDQFALEPMFKFVQAYAAAPDWRFRYTSALLLNAASQLPSFTDNIKNIFVGFDFFVKTIADPIPRISEVAMWSLGRMIEEIPELASDEQRFNVICDNVLQRLNVSEELTSRACWLLGTSFCAFSAEEVESPLAKNFVKLSENLLQVVDVYGVTAQDAAFGALNRLVEHTSSTLTAPYNLLFQKATAKLQTLIEDENAIRNNAKYTQELIGLLSLIQAIVINVGPIISSVSDELMMLLIRSLNLLGGELVCEVLPAMGAVARAIGSNFGKYLQVLLGKVFEYLSQEEYVQPAAVFVNDIFNAFESFPDELTNQFVQTLFKALQMENLTIQARLATFTALSEIAKQIGPKSIPWLEAFLELLEEESRSVMPNNNDIDLNNANTFVIEALQIYQTLVPILQQIPKGDRKIRNFFYIFEKITNLEKIDDEILIQSVLLIRLIAITFGRKVNVYINKPAVWTILKMASESQEENLALLGTQVLEIVRQF
ncbi:importin subunit beta-1 [Histomonas meleagridis]|uniref:importin subunit beta-1 n=1 Tax=Histomonas meleagridis TaxID=135588 RepID=UPI0035594730|nr:importin subunit beta-1 [Histomonas meleagridis]KAH0802622.1 importin subunit beta-1 [Histomonas meleagridis]